MAKQKPQRSKTPVPNCKVPDPSLNRGLGPRANLSENPHSLPHNHHMKPCIVECG
ncbi:hypothetical protein K440DRAFT_635014 [Wilcoxina mikolae CBS 423.85]|nr:hypothetical protein K440DRAFT_635014 [Wilcoxina mikolae CBS 423.85]